MSYYLTYHHMVMSEQTGLPLHQTQQQPPRHNIVQPTLIMRRRQGPESSCSIRDNCTSKLSNEYSECTGCGCRIYDRFIFIVSPDLEWHAECLKCKECNMLLTESCTCFVRNGNVFCKEDYMRLYGTKCDKCGVLFTKTDFVMKAKTKTYHVECFRCFACTRPLVSGDEFALKEDGALYCKEDHDVMEKCNSANRLPIVFDPNLFKSSAETNNNINLINHNTNSSANVSEMGCGSDSGSDNGSHKGVSLNRQKVNTNVDGKPTRVRTVLNEKQLQTLRQCYAANPRPDALMKEQLVDLTGLSPRVIRVWFQNKRCKDKKKSILIKQQMEHEMDGRSSRFGSMQGIPMVATSPVRHESPQGMLSLDVQRYQPPWPTLNEYALHADLNQNNGPAIQHLINQMHGYELPPSALVPNQNMLMPCVPPPLNSDSLIHPDSTDGFVTYMESDESLHSSP